MNIPAVPPVAAIPVPTATPIPPTTVPARSLRSPPAPPPSIPAQPSRWPGKCAARAGSRLSRRSPACPDRRSSSQRSRPRAAPKVYLPDSAAYNVTFTLYPISRASNAQVTVLVYCPVTFFFGQGDGCPTGPAADVGASYQEFENGFMIWRQDTNEIYVFYSDGTASYFLQQDYAQLPDPVIKEAPPLDRQTPGGGFGKVWFNAPNVRAQARLGAER